MLSATRPGNARQRRHVMERRGVMVAAALMGVSALPADLARQPEANASVARFFAEVIERVEQKSIQAALLANALHREKSAKAFGVCVRTPHYRITKSIALDCTKERAAVNATPRMESWRRNRQQDCTGWLAAGALS